MNTGLRRLLVRDRSGGLGAGSAWDSVPPLRCHGCGVPLLERVRHQPLRVRVHGVSRRRDGRGQDMEAVVRAAVGRSHSTGAVDRGKGGVLAAGDQL